MRVLKSCRRDLIARGVQEIVGKLPAVFAYDPFVLRRTHTYIYTMQDISKYSKQHLENNYLYSNSLLTHTCNSVGHAGDGR